MITPNKYTDYNMSIVNVAAIVIKFLDENGAMRYNDTLKQVQNKVGEESKHVFQNALNFLFLLGKINYFSKEDLLELII